MSYFFNDDFSCYRIPSDYPMDWREIEPTFHLSSPTSSQEIDEKPNKTRSTSAYALFFREKQAIEKRQNPYTTFGELSQRIARQWDMLSIEEKKKYKIRCERNRKNKIAKAVEEKARKLIESTFLMQKNINAHFSK